MKITAVIALAALVAASAVTISNAQDLRDADESAEFPSSSYKGTQYIDSRGCVYIRAGIGGDVSWILQATRSRKQICGQMPSDPGDVAKTRPAVKKPFQVTSETPKG